MAKQQYEGVLRRANEMAESIKQAIVLLQIAKNATAPEEPGAVKEFNGPEAAGSLTQNMSSAPSSIPSVELESKDSKVDGAEVAPDSSTSKAATDTAASRASSTVAPNLLKPGNLRYDTCRKAGI